VLSFAVQTSCYMDTGRCLFDTDLAEPSVEAEHSTEYLGLHCIDVFTLVYSPSYKHDEAGSSLLALLVTFHHTLFSAQINIHMYTSHTTCPTITDVFPHACG
jgi:hypothetical protein